MISRIIILFALSTAFVVKGQVSPKEIHKSLVPIDDKLYAGKYEVSHEVYNAFLEALSGSGQQDVLSMVQIDSVQWLKKSYYNQPYVNYYHRHPAYKGYPVVNISHEAAVQFCEWLTNEYHSNSKRKFNKVVFRLPTEAEWISAAKAGDPAAVYGWTGNQLRNKKGEAMGNWVRDKNDTLGVASASSDNADVTAPVRSYFPNKAGIYNMSGNVAEMVQDPTVLTGGSWMHTPDFLLLEKDIPYDSQPAVYAGFRYFMEVLEE